MKNTQETRTHWQNKARWHKKRYSDDQSDLPEPSVSVHVEERIIPTHATGKFWQNKTQPSHRQSRATHLCHKSSWNTLGGSRWWSGAPSSNSDSNQLEHYFTSPNPARQPAHLPCPLRRHPRNTEARGGPLVITSMWWITSIHTGRKIMGDYHSWKSQQFIMVSAAIWGHRSHRGSQHRELYSQKKIAVVFPFSSIKSQMP